MVPDYWSLGRWADDTAALVPGPPPPGCGGEECWPPAPEAGSLPE